MKKYLFLFLMITILACKQEAKQPVKKLSDNQLKYAKGFTYQSFEKYTSIKVLRPFKNAKTTFEYILITGDTIIKPTHKNQIVVKTPIHKIIATSTTQIPVLESLNAEHLLKGFPNTKFVSSTKTRKLIDNQKIIEVGHQEHIDTELVLSIQPDAMFAFAVNNLNKSHITLKKAGIPIVIDASWLEESPLGRAEWIKFFGLFLNKEKEANDVFQKIEANYLKAVNVVHKQVNKPTILYGSMYSDVWYAPAGDSYIAKIMKDAQTDYLWKNTTGTGSLSLQFENVFIKGKEADFWFAPGYAANEQILDSKNKHYQQFKPYQQNKVYTYTNTVGATGGLLFFELGALRPDLILNDIVKICHPELLPEYRTTFFKRLE
ncbi:ABC transporter substrate-binding protein [Wenyingzhuangia sp. IMCC45533]